MDANTSNITPILPTEGMDGTAAASVAAAASAYAQFALQAAALVPGQDGQLVLPSGVSLDNIRVVGRDLVIRMPDGSEVVVPDGAVFVPQFVVDGVAVPPVNLAALLIGQEPQPAAGPPQSSGGNFSQTPGDIGDPFGLGDLLPPTELAFPEPEQRELVPGLIDRDPDVNIQDGGPAGKDVTDNVSEVGLPGTRTNGNVESPGSSTGNGSDSTTGTIIVTSPDGIASITINGVVYTGAGQQITTSTGVLTLGALSGDQIPYTYRLTDNTSGDSTTDVFTVVLTDPDGDSSTARLTIVIADDVPTARNDTDSVAGGTYGPETGNVLSGSGTTSGTAGADTLGADGAAISGFRAGTEGAFATVGSTINGQYGTLTLGANGTYSYVRNTNTPGGVTDVFSYRLTDGDGDTSTATLTINIGDAPNRITFIPEIGDGTQVREPHLPARDGEPSGSQFDGNSEATSGTITFNSPDGVGSVKVSGVTITPGSLPQTVSSDATGTLVVTAYSYDPVTGVGSITYTYTLNDNTLNTAGSTVTFPVVVTDLDGDAASDDLNIKIIDDAPLAANDSGTQASENAAVTVNVLANDTPGADGVNPATGVALVAGSLSGAGSVAYAGNGNFTYTPAPGEEGTVTFQYTITDGDGDPSTATVTITLLKDSEPRVDVSGENFVDEAGLPARGSEPEGSNAASDSETTSGTIAVSTGGDTLQSLVINGVNVTAGGTVTGAHGTLTVTVSAGAYSYSYTLTDNTAGEGTTDSFNVVVTDSDGDSANDNLVIAIHDDVPTAIKDADSIAAGEYGPATGNVITDAEGDGGTDTQGADGAIVTAVSGVADGIVGGSTNGLYGVLTLNSDGSYSYTRNPGTPGGVTDVFKYTITDGDGDPSETTLTISIGDSRTTLDLPTKGEAGTEVDEAGLATGSAAATNGEFTNGTIAYTAPDGPATVTIDGVAVTAVGQTFTGSFGTLTITSIAAGTIGYEYELTTNTSGDATFDDFAVVVTDQDGDNTPGTLVIDIVDDVPTARADEDSVKEDGPTVADGNVITGANVADANATDGVADTRGADDANVTGVVFGAVAGPVSGNVGSNVSGTYGFLTIAADGTYSYTLNNEDPRVQGLDKDDSLTETFTYTITDGDGDPSTTTIKITINGNDDPITINGLNVEGPDLIVDEDDLPVRGTEPAGSDATPETLIKTGSFTVTGVDGIASVKIEGNEATVGQTITTSYGKFTITSISAPADGSSTAITIGYSYELTDNTAHPNANGENFITELFDVAVTDTDGSTDTDQVEVRIIDDVPTAEDDTDVIAGGSNAPATGNVITDNDAGDAGDSDLGKDTQGADGVTVTAISGFGGAGTVDGTTNGQYGVLTLNADGSYSYVRNDGTPGNVSDVFTYEITDGDGDKDTATLTITIEDDRPIVGPNKVVLVDDDSLGGNPASTTGDDADPQNETGTLSGSGGDGALTWAFQTTGAPAGFQYVASGSNILVQQDQGGSWVTVATATLVPSTGAYTVTLNNNVIHADGDNENNLSVTLNYTVSDVDLDSTPGTLTINFDDDAPTLSVDGPTTVVEGASTVGGTWSQAIGADQPGATTVVVVGGTNYALGAPINTGNGTLTVLANGTWTFVANNNLDNDLNPSVTFTVRVTDADNDVAEDTQTIAITDGAGPQAGGPLTLALDDQNLADGSTPGNPDFTSGTVSFTAGSDALTSFAFAASVASLGAGLTWTRVSNTLIEGRDGGNLIVSLTLTPPASIAAGGNGTATVTATLHDNYDSHPSFTADDLVNLGSVGVVASDHDGDSTTATVNVTVSDDVPALSVDGPTTVVEGASTVGGTWSQAIGADQPGATTVVVVGGTNYALGAPINTGNGTLTVLANGTWTFVANNNLDNDLNPSVTFTVRVTDADNDVAEDTQTIAITDGAGPQAGGPLTLALDDQNLADGSTPANPDFTSGTVSFTAGSDALTSFAFAASVAGLGAGLSWTRVSDTLIEGRDGANLIVSLTLTPPAPIAAGGNGTATVTATLHDNYDSHPIFTSDDVVNLGSVGVVASDHDGDSTTATVNVSVSDDLPLAQSNFNTAVEGGTAVGNVLGNDTFGADGPATTTPAGGVVGVRALGGDFTTPVTTGTGTQITGLYGKLTLNADGSYSYDGDPNVISTAQADVFVYTIRDADGDLSTTTLTINLTPVTLVPDNDTVTVNEAGLDLVNDAGPDTVAGTVNGSNPTSNSDVAQGTLVVAGATNFVLTSASGGSYGTLVLNSNGTYTYTLTKPFDTTPDTNNGITTETGKDVFNYTATDANGNSINGTITVDIVDDVPTATATAVPASVAALDETATSSTAATLGASLIGDDPDVAGSGRISFATTAGAVVTAGGVYGADGANAVNPLIYELVVTNGISGLAITDGATITLVKEGNLVVGRVDSGTFAGTAAFAIAINATSGIVTVEQYLSLKHPLNTNPNESVSLILGSLGATVTRTDGDGDKSTSTAADISGQIRFGDDGPTAIDPDPVPNNSLSPDVLFNIIGDSTTVSLDVDDNVANNFGADGPGSITFANIVSGVTNSGLTHDGQPILLYLDASGTVLTGKALVGGILQDVFTVTLNQGASNYEVELIRTIDNGSGATFNNLSGGVAGNPPFKLVESTGTVDNTELLFTPREAGAADANGSINSDTDDLGVNGQFIDLGFGVSIDFGNFTYIANGGGTSDDRYDYVSEGDINGFRFTIDQISNGSTVDMLLKAYEYTGNPAGTVQQISPNEAQYAQENISTVKVYTAAGTLLHTIQIDWTVPGVKISAVDADGLPIASATGTALTIGGITYGVASGGTVLISNLLSDYKIETYTADGYDRLVIDNVGAPSTTDGKFSISELQIQQTNSGTPVNLQLDLQITDGDGDSVVIADAIDITVLPASAAPPPPVVLDLDGDGAEFLSSAAGVAFDYTGDGNPENTAWVGADDGLLAIDSNANGLVDNGSEIVFGGNGLTDLEGLAANYDSNEDGVLDANDADFAKFGVWQDANSNGVTDAGEFQSLTSAGITSINLVSDGIEYAAANGEVTVHGTSSYTTADGDSFDVADASFATGGDASKTGGVESKVAANENDQRSLASASAGMAGSMVAAGLVAAVAIEHDAIDAVLSKVGSFDGSMRADGFASLQSAPFEATSAGDYFTGMHSMDALTSNFGDNAIKSSSFDRMADIDSFQNDSFGADRVEALASNLLAPTELDHGMFNMSNGASMGMAVDAGSQALIALQDAGFAQNALQDVVADALAGGAGQGANVDALLNALAGPANEMSLLGDSLAQTFGDNAVFEALSFNNGHDMFDQITTTQMELSAATGHHG